MPLPGFVVSGGCDVTANVTLAPQRLRMQRQSLPTLGVKQTTGRREERRGSAHERGYGARWRAAREGFLRSHPLCCCCKANGRIVAASLVDHIEPHRGDMVKFWQSSNWQPLCKSCHDSIKAVFEKLHDDGKCTIADLSLSRLLPQYFPT